MERAARVWKRILAFMLDLYFCLVATWAFFTLLASELPSAPEFILESATPALSPLAVTAFLYASIFVLLYHVFCEYIVGQTAGMLMVGVRVQPRADSANARTRTKGIEKPGIGFWQALGRNAFIIPMLPFTLLWLADPLYYAFHGERLLEHWTSTETVE